MFQMLHDVNGNIQQRNARFMFAFTQRQFPKYSHRLNNIIHRND